MSDNKSISIALLVISDRASAGTRRDLVEDAMTTFLNESGQKLSRTEIVPDEIEAIGGKLIEWTGSGKFDLILTGGGTGVSPRDVTPEATRPLLDREIPGIPEAMRAESMKITSYAALSRGYAGFRGKTMIINLPGSPKAAVENLRVVFKAVVHGIEKFQGDMSDCNPSEAAPPT